VILVDTTPLVALCDPSDALHARALRDLDRLRRRDFVVCGPVMAEACFLLPRSVQRQRLERIVSDLSMRPLVMTEEGEVWTEVFRWLKRYAEHDPDWADAYLAIVSGREKRASVWTYDREFRTTWRRLDGGSIPVAVASPRD
jgi:predicted nucleic acid-binding protein